jgi:hypothetical protein
MSKKKITTHSFLIEDAVKHGVNKAIILHNLRFWLERAKANESHIHDGHYWIYNTSKAFGELFPYFSESSIARWLRELEKDGVVLSNSKLNKAGFDHTKWYTIKDEYRILDIDKSNSQSGSTIPDINTDGKPDSKPDINIKSFKVLNEEEFKQDIRDSKKDEYSNSMLRAFFDHWSEKSANGKMKFQLERTWETGKRLAKWKSNADKWGGSSRTTSSTQQPQDDFISREVAAAQAALDKRKKTEQAQQELF